MTKSIKQIKEARERHLREEWGEREDKFQSVFDKAKKESYLSKQIKARLERATPHAIQLSILAVLFMIPIILRLFQ